MNWPELERLPRVDDAARCYRVLVTDLVGLLPDSAGNPDPAAFAAHVHSRGASFWQPGASGSLSAKPTAAGIVFEYHPHLSQAQELVAAAGAGDFAAVIAAATFIPSDCEFAEGGVRIGAGTANMASRSWTAGAAPLMNTPGFNSRATAQMAFKALLQVRPTLPLAELHKRVCDNTFDTGADLQHYPTHKLEGLTMAVLGFGNIGREVALLARAFGMRVRVYARPAMKQWVEAEGFEFASSIVAAARGADILSPHLGLGAAGADGFANADLINAQVLAVMAENSVLINFDRGELVSAQALGEALRSGQLSHAAIDADVFLDPVANSSSNTDANSISGPLAPYLALLSEHRERLLLLPHVAADTDHPSRVAGAIQAADQIIAAIRYRCVANCVGRVPAGYTDLGRASLPGIGNVSAQSVARLAGDASAIRELRAQLAEVDAWLADIDGAAKSAATVDTQPAIRSINKLSTVFARLGLLGPGVQL